MYMYKIASEIWASTPRSLAAQTHQNINATADNFATWSKGMKEDIVERKMALQIEISPHVNLIK